MHEIWKPVVGYEGLYEVSSEGQVRSLYREAEVPGRWGITKMRFPAKPMRICRTRTGYCYAALSRDAKQTKHFVHRLVMAAFCGASELQVNHKDGVKDNNHLENLEYCTASENLLHSTRVLRKRIGEANGAAKLTEEDVIKIRGDGRILREIAADYGVTLQAIHHVKTGKNWAAFGDAAKLKQLKKEAA